jgi:23S rRNA (adenine2503-C2)-methyltransferase
MKIIKSLSSRDGKTTKFLQQTGDKNVIETGFYDLDEYIVCISSQIGCAMGCIFCATTSPNKSGQLSFIRNLEADEIVTQTMNALTGIPKEKLFSKKILFSYMGMGEPLLNYNNIIASIRVLTKKFPNSRATISTIGVDTKKMCELAQEEISTTLKLHLSVHAPNDVLRKQILPTARPLKEALNALEYFSKKRKVLCKVNYVLISGVNDSRKHAEELAKLLKGYQFTVKLSNLNDFNGLEGSGTEKFELFENILKKAGLATCRFISIGTDIEAGCGQLRRGIG